VLPLGDELPLELLRELHHGYRAAVSWWVSSAPAMKLDRCEIERSLAS
jgi:hypothetical protein